MNIIIVDDDQLVSLSLKTILEAGNNINVLDIGKDGEDAINLYKQYIPDVLLMDIQMANMTGLEAASAIIAQYPDAKILLLTTFSDDEYIVKAIRLGAKGYILKQDFESIAPALFAVHNGQTVFGSEIIEKLPGLWNSNQTRNVSNTNYKNFNLTDKEYDIIKLVADGQNNKEISSELFLSEGTVRNYISNILEKLELRDRTQLACFYYNELN